MACRPAHLADGREDACASLRWASAPWGRAVSRPCPSPRAHPSVTGVRAPGTVLSRASVLPQGIQFLIENDLLQSSPEDVAQFLYKGEGLNKTVIGDYLGER